MSHRPKAAVTWLTAYESARQVMPVDAAMERAADAVREAHGVVLSIREDEGRVVATALLPSGESVEASEATCLTPTTRLRLTARVLTSLRMIGIGYVVH